MKFGPSLVDFVDEFFLSTSYKSHSEMIQKLAENMNSVTWLWFLLFASFSSSLCKTLPFPKQFKRCRKNDPNLDDCVKDAIQKALPHLIKGLPKYGLNPVDPLVAKSITLSQDFGPFPLNATFHQVVSRGNADSTIKAAHVEVDKYLLSASAYTPRVTLDGDYHLQAKVFRFPLEGSGGYEIQLNGVTTNVTYQGKGEERDGDIFFKIVNTTVTMEVEDINFNFKNLYNPDGTIGKNINWFLNRLSMHIFRETRPLIQETQSKLACMLAERFFKRVPYSQFYL